MCADVDVEAAALAGCADCVSVIIGYFGAFLLCCLLELPWGITGAVLACQNCSSANAGDVLGVEVVD